MWIRLCLNRPLTRWIDSRDHTKNDIESYQECPIMDPMTIQLSKDTHVAQLKDELPKSIVYILLVLSLNPFLLTQKIWAHKHIRPYLIVWYLYIRVNCYYDTWVEGKGQIDHSGCWYTGKCMTDCISLLLHHPTHHISKWTMACTPSLKAHRSTTRSANQVLVYFTATLKMRLAMDDRQIKNLQKKASAWMSNLSNEPIETAWVVITRSNIASTTHKASQWYSQYSYETMLLFLASYQTSIERHPLLQQANAQDIEGYSVIGDQTGKGNK